MEEVWEGVPCDDEGEGKGEGEAKTETRGAQQPKLMHIRRR